MVQVLLQIDKDVRRLCPDLTFFQQATAHPSPRAGEKLHTRVTQAQLEAQVTRDICQCNSVTVYFLCEILGSLN